MCAKASLATIKSNAAVYLYTGPEFGERNDAVEKIRAQTKKKFGDAEEYLFYATETSIGEIVSLLQSGSLFSSAKFVLVKAAEVIKKKDDVETLVSWIDTSNDESSVLVLVSDEISIEKKIDSAINAANKKVFWEMFEDRKIPWLKNYFSQNGYRINTEACEYILELVENNTQALRNECSRFFLLMPQGTEITVDDVENLLEHNREESAFTLFATMTQMAGSTDVSKTLESCLEILQKIRLSKNSSSVMILAGLSSCFRKLSLWQKLSSEGKTDDFSLKINGFSSKKMKSQYSAANRIWNSGQTAAIRALIADTDMAIRSGGTLMEQTLLSRLIIEIVAKRGSSCAEYETSI